MNPYRTSAPKPPARMTLLGSTPEDVRRSLGLIATAILVSPFIAAAELWNLVGRPGCRRSV